MARWWQQLASRLVGGAGTDQQFAPTWTVRGASPGPPRVFAWLLVVVRVPFAVLTRSRWSGLDHLPARGGVVVASNHVSWADPVTLATFLLYAGRTPSFLAKDSLFRVPGLGAILRATGQVPVQRGKADASEAYSSALQRLRGGGCVVMYTDGTLTKDPEQWPMVGKSGSVRLALETGSPLVPVVQWGVQRLLPREGRPRLFPRAPLQVVVGPPVDLSAWSGAPLTAAVLREATAVVVDTLVAMLEDVRGESAPPRWDLRAERRTEVSS